jgi:hypothetical protein
MARHDRPADVRAEFTEFDDDGTTIALIRDPENSRAWIESTVSCPVDP